MANLVVRVEAFNQEEMKPGDLIIIHRQEAIDQIPYHMGGFIIEVAPLEIKAIVYYDGSLVLFENPLESVSMVIHIPIEEVVSGQTEIRVIDPTKEVVMG